MLKRILITLLLCSPAFAIDSGPEPLLGHVTSSVGVHIQVRSGGCTWKEQFHVENTVVGDVHHISFVRDTADLCRAHLPYGEVLTFSYEELGLDRGDRFQISNSQAGGRVN